MINASAFRLPTKSSEANTKSHMVPRIERVIDRAIHKANGRKSEVRIDVQRSWMRHEIVHVLGKYAAAGWNAQLVFDDVSGDYILLAPATQPVVANGQPVQQQATA